MGVSGAMVWWDEWKLRILVLCSLFVQFFLYFSQIVRTLYVLRWLRLLVWIAYLGGDALAVYALATLFNRQKQQMPAAGGGGSGNDALELIWAPVLLIHLGGQSISAYSLEDNELWKRHVITLVSQVTVALYVFCKWWSGEKRLLHVAILLFIIGILRFGEKPWALRRASFRTLQLQTSTNLSPAASRRTVWTLWSILCCTSFLDILPALHQIRQGKEKEGGEGNKKDQPWSLEEYVTRARELVLKPKSVSAGAGAGGGEAQAQAQVEAQQQVSKKIAASAHQMLDDTTWIYTMFLDLSAPYYIRLQSLHSFLSSDEENQHIKLRDWIQWQFLSMYTKVRSAGTTCLSCCLVFLLPMLALASVILFAKSDKDGYNKSDITVTYILFSGTVVIEFAPVCYTLGFGLYMAVFFKIAKRKKPQAQDVVACYTWQDMVSQHSIMSYCAWRKKPNTVMKLATLSYLRNLISKYWCIWYEPAAQRISVLVRRHAEGGWKEYIHDAATYRRFDNFRGDHTLRKHNLLGLGEKQLGWSMNLPFDECVLLWHIATDLCFHYHTNSSSNPDTATASSSAQSQEDTIESRRSSSEIISNYMVYLLFICPNMLMLGTRQDLFMIACRDIEIMIKQNVPPSRSLDKSSIAQRILGKQQGDEDLVMVPKAQKLARVLIHCLNEEERWKVIQGVWVEMLCYSASRCRGYEHAKSLAHGGEYLTNVWLLWSSMGMETLPDKIQNQGPPEDAQV